MTKNGKHTYKEKAAIIRYNESLTPEQRSANARYGGLACAERRKNDPEWKFKSLRRSMSTMMRRMKPGDMPKDAAELLEKMDVEPTMGNLMLASSLLRTVLDSDKDAVKMWIEETEGKTPEKVVLVGKGKIDLGTMTDEDLQRMIDEGASDDGFGSE